jgi:hypothetical protein
MNAMRPDAETLIAPADEIRLTTAGQASLRSAFSALREDSEQAPDPPPHPFGLREGIGPHPPTTTPAGWSSRAPGAGCPAAIITIGPVEGLARSGDRTGPGAGSGRRAGSSE